MWYKMKEFTVGVLVAFGIIFVAKETMLKSPTTTFTPIKQAQAATTPKIETKKIVEVKPVVIAETKVFSKLPEKKEVQVKKLPIQKVAFKENKKQEKVRKIKPNTISLVSQ